MRSAARLYRLQLAMIAAGLGIVTFAAAKALGAIVFEPGSLEGLLAACKTLLPSLGVGEVAALALAGVGVAALALGLRSLVRQVLATRRYVASLPLTGQELDLAGTRCWITADREASAFCAGFVRPRVYLSERALELLAPQELLAVIAHERHHRDRRDPLRILVLRALADALFFLPILKSMTRRYASLIELAADEAAVAKLTDRKPLAGALLRFGIREPSPAVIAAITPERVDHLAGDPAATRWRLPATAIGLSFLLGGFVLAAGVGVALSDGAPVDLASTLAQTCMLLMIGAPMAALGAGGLSWCRALPAVGIGSRRGQS